MIRSPFFYVGDKYKLMPQLIELFPNNITTYVEPFLGGGSSFLNVDAKEYILNDVNMWVIKLHNELNKYTYDKDILFDKLFNIIDKYDLSCSYRGKTTPLDLKKQFPKTHYAKYNKQAYINMKEDFNNDQKDILLLYLLLIYGFNHMIRFNKQGMFNLPVGDVDFNNNVYSALNNYLDFCNDRKITFNNSDYRDFINDLKLNKKNTYIYCDPPYTISSSEYNKMWSTNNDVELFLLLDRLDKKGIKFGLSNLLKHKGQTNYTLDEWRKKYNTYYINSNYISFNDNTFKKNSEEIFVTNYTIDK